VCTLATANGLLFSGSLKHIRVCWGMNCYPMLIQFSSGLGRYVAQAGRPGLAFFLVSFN
jgi:hypothetical protein